jgi:hypothetical protein
VNIALQFKRSTTVELKCHFKILCFSCMSSCHGVAPFDGTSFPTPT